MMDFDSLSDGEKRKYFEDIRREILTALEASAKLVSTASQAEVHHYLDHNELGLAIELLVQILMHENLPVDKSIKTSIMITLTRMGYASDEPELYEAYGQWCKEGS